MSETVQLPQSLAGWNFTVEPLLDGTSELRTEREYGVQQTCGSGSESTGS